MLSRRSLLVFGLLTLASHAASQELKTSPVKWRVLFTAPVSEVATWSIQPPATPPDKLSPAGKNGVQVDLPPGSYTLTGEQKSGDFSFSFQYEFTLTGQAPVQPPKITLAASPLTIEPGQYSRLTWTVTGAVEVTLDGVLVKPADTLVVTPDKTTTYVMIAKAEGNIESTAKVMVTVNVGPQPPPQIKFTAEPLQVESGGSSKLTWVVTGAATVKLDDQVVKAADSKTVTPEKTTVYKLVAAATDGTSAAAEVTVTVGTPPIPTKGLYVLIVEETGKRNELTAGQREILLSEKPGGCIDYMNSKCAKGPNNLPTWAMLDPNNTDLSKVEKVWQDAMNRPRDSVPWIVISNGTDGFEGPLPKTAEECLQLLKKFGG